MEARNILLIMTGMLLISANIFEKNFLYLLSLFAWSAYLIKPIKDDIRDIKKELKRR